MTFTYNPPFTPPVNTIDFPTDTQMKSKIGNLKAIAEKQSANVSLHLRILFFVLTWLLIVPSRLWTPRIGALISHKRIDVFKKIICQWNLFRLE